MNEFLEPLAEIGHFSEPFILMGFLVFTRVAGMVALMPAFGEQMIPVRVRLAAAIAFTLIVAPLVTVPAQYSPLTLIGEAAVGLLYGLGMRFFIFALQTAGTMIAQAISLAQLFGLAGEPQPVVGSFLTLAALALVVATGLHIRAAALIVQSYELFPPGSGLPAPDLAQWGVAQVSRSFGLAVSLAAPFLIASLLYNMALGIINRAMPQLMVTFIGAPAITLAGIALLAVAAPLMLDIWRGAFDGFMNDPLAAAGR